jgi:hypothetical protein
MPAVFMVDAEILCVDQGEDRIALILSGRKRGLDGEMNGEDAREVSTANASVKDKIEHVEFVEQRKRDIEDAIQKLQEIYLTLSE